MSEAQPPDLFLGQTLTELERLIVVKRDLCASKYINVLVNKKLREIMSRCTGANYIVSLDNFRRLAGILNSNKSANGVCLIFRQADLVDFLKSKVKQKVDSHPSNSMSEATQKSTLELFEDLEFWLLLKALLEESFALDKAFTDSITKIISFDVAACPLVTFPIPGSLRVVEVGAKVMKALPLQHRSKILQVIDSHIKGLATTDIECSAGYVHISGKSAAIDVGNGGVAPAGGQDHRELTIGKKAHAKVRWNIHHSRYYRHHKFQAQIRHLEEQAVQYKATISGPHQDKDIWTQEKICLESRVRELIQKLSGIQSSDLEFQQENLKLHSQMAELKTANAGLEKKFRHSGSKDQTVGSLSPILTFSRISNTMAQRIRKLEDEVAILRQALLDQKYAHDTVRARVLPL